MQLIKIGNSQGLRIPKTLIEQANFRDTELSLKIVEEGILISPKRKLRAGWKESIDSVDVELLSQGVDREWLDASLDDFWVDDFQDCK